MIAKKVIFTGKVQGVGFRYVTKQLALGFDVIGWVRNLSDGTVELQIMGEGDEVDEFIQEIVEESDLASHVREFAVSEIPPLEDCRGFSIK
ncbi:acylphosphatase [bacterium]|nr:acylphosphatase [Akkermansiaceae bacterium]MDA7536792.1 acylphosphatase [bacterium]MDA7519298.1 acylphosphatase [Akkermansiaceae bacterium]MDA7538163.1 acylphosphatase [Akkermansiaceae bacterium]MDA7629202.1 acylphosphatase [Akkermansiaceae bacterium]